jgi:predicted O-linked N-acetylglucosamine transferase (SPINDLY family)
MYRLREAEQAIREGIRLAPRQAEAHHQLGIVLVRQGKASEAEAVLRQALALDPALVTARTELAEVLRMQGRVDAADAAYGDAAAVEPGAERGLYFLGPVYDGADPAQILERHRSWGDKLIAAARPTSAERALFSNQRDPGRRLRVGLVSPDFRTHSVSYFLEPLLACLDRDAVETYCYAEVFSPDDTTARLRALAAHWRPTIELDDEAFRNQVRADRVDILLDLAGHTGGNRLAAFAIRPAPVTAAWLGYPTTTGLATIDWRMTDATADPPGAEAHYVERLQRIDGAFLCFGPPGDAPDVGPLPALTAGRITFGTFNNLLKVTPVAVAAWAEILRALPGSRLLLKTLLLRDEQARQRWSRIFADFGVAPDRLELRGGTTDRAGHLASYAEVDIALDTFPYNGTATTCEALWAGVPVVALCGDRHSGRVGASLLGRAGLADLIQPDPQAYVRCAVRLAGDLPSLSVRRATLRGQLAASPLCDGPGFARAFGAGLRRMWGEWCRTGME